jgi:putative glutamine amidotransferase
VTLRPGGPLAALAAAAGVEGDLMVNSLHWQALDRVADRLIVEAEAEDGTPEAVSVRDARAFALGVQWHPEYKAWENPFSRQLFEAFGAAARRHAAGGPAEDAPTLAVSGPA